MPSGLIALLDDVATIAKLAASSLDDVAAAAGKATTKATGVVIDDTAVTPRYVIGLAPERELPIIGKIAWGSLKNKIAILLPAALLLTAFAPFLITPLLMLGGAYLAFEATEKILEKLLHEHEHEEQLVEAIGDPHELEKMQVKGAIRTDFILSAEIMVIALNEVADQAFVPRLIILVVVALVITAAVYGVVAVIVKMDDVGLSLTQRSSRFAKKIGRGLVSGMPMLLAALSTIGTVAMLWVGGHILLVGTDTLGWHAPYSLVHHAEEWVKSATEAFAAVSGVLAWLVNTAASAVIGLVVGAIVVGVVHVLPFGKKKDAH
jgi:predicted DNA repair protein MutK